MSQFPLTLRHHDIRRLVERKAQCLVLSRRLALGAVAINDARVEHRNNQARRQNRPDLQQDSHVMTVEIDDRREMRLMDLTLGIVMSAGFKTQRDFFDDWLQRRRWIDCELQVFVHSFHLVSDARYLHVRVHRGYASSPSLAVKGEPEALSKDELEELSRRARWRREQNEEFQRQARRSIGLRAKDAAVRGDVRTFGALAGELAALAGTVSAGSAISA